MNETKESFISKDTGVANIQTTEKDDAKPARDISDDKPRAVDFSDSRWKEIVFIFAEKILRDEFDIKNLDVDEEKRLREIIERYSSKSLVAKIKQRYFEDQLDQLETHYFSHSPLAMLARIMANTWRAYGYGIDFEGSELLEGEYSLNVVGLNVIDKLREDYGVTQLREYELARLKELVKECVDKARIDDDLAKAGELRTETRFDAVSEAVARWLFELYGIRPEEEYLTTRRYIAVNKEESDRVVVDEKFKKYLQILRDRGAIGEDKL